MKIRRGLSVFFLFLLLLSLSLSPAALAAEGTSIVTNRHYIDRGYEDLVLRLRELGAAIELA